MKIEIIPKDQKEEEIEFPCLMQNIGENTIVLAMAGNGSYFCGSVIYNDPHEKRYYPIGGWKEEWYRHHFKKFEGKITLSND